MYSKFEHKDLNKTISASYEADLSIQQFSRNHTENVQERTRLEVECLLKANESFKFFDIKNEEDKMVGYFGIETTPISVLSTFFVMPEYRKDKDSIWNYIVSHFDNEFYVGLFTVNTRAIKFLVKQGGEFFAESISENKPMIVYKFKR